MQIPISNSKAMEASQIDAMVAPMLLHPLTDAMYGQLAGYVNLLYRWNAQINLTAVRDVEVLVGLHIAECLRAAQLIPASVSTVLDFGSGAGLPGIPMQIAHPELAVTLAESQTKKAGFLREAIRALELRTASVVSGRVEDLPAEHLFDLVAMRAVDRMERALVNAGLRVKSGGYCMVLTSGPETGAIRTLLPSYSWQEDLIPGTERRVVLLGRKEK